MRYAKIVATSVIGSALVSGCAVQTDAPENHDQASTSVDTSFGHVDPPAGHAEGSVRRAEQTARLSIAEVGSTYTWHQNEDPYVMMHQDDGFCFLTGVGGHFEGLGESVRIDNWNGYWVLTGRSQQAGIYATAVCVPWADLTESSLWRATWNWVSNSSDGPFASYSEIVLQPAQSFCFLGGMSGSMWEAGVGPTISYDVPNHRWLARASPPPYGQSSAMGMCLDYRYVEEAPFTGASTWSQGEEWTYLGPTSDRVCALTKVTGRFRGDGEHVEVVQYEGNWYLKGGSLQSGVGASARCLSLHW